ncbi:MAG: hypothetical protein ACTSVC_09480 [Promethearchaeota archaeon]
MTFDEILGEYYIKNLYLKPVDSRRNLSSARYIFYVCTEDGASLGANKELNELGFIGRFAYFPSDLSKFVYKLQTNEQGMFSEIKIFCMESSILYSGEKTPHYYLRPILVDPGKKFNARKAVRPIKACKNCDTMLLRYSFNWKMMRNDLELDNCPYCGKKLEIIERDARVVPTYLDFDAKDCSVSGVNYQIGLIYNNIHLKATIKVRGLLYFLKNYANLYDNHIIGPMSVLLSKRFGFYNIKDAIFEELAEEIEWRPAVLLPEDMIII